MRAGATRRAVRQLTTEAPGRPPENEGQPGWRATTGPFTMKRVDIDLAALLALLLVTLAGAAVAVVAATRSEGTVRRVVLGTAAAVLVSLAVVAAVLVYWMWQLAAHITF